MNGKWLKAILNVPAQHALYREDGDWYHHLREFPGALFDRNGYLIFASRSEYLSHSSLQHTKDLHVVNGISSIQGYLPYTYEEKLKIILADRSNVDRESLRTIRQVNILVRNFRLVKRIKKLYENVCQICGIQLEAGRNLYYSEIHHIRPLGNPHSGPDRAENMLCVCPNCHAQLDFGAIELATRKMNFKHDIDLRFIKYHNEIIFNQNVI